MNDAHLHMVVNHFPIIGTILGFGVLLVGLIIKNKTVRNVSYCLFIVAAIFAAISMATGDGAEHMVVDFPNIGRKIIHQHEEMAEKLALTLYVLGLASITGFIFNLKNNPKEKMLAFVALTIAAVSVFLAQQTGTSGGEIRHTEIRTSSTATSIENHD